MTKEEYAKSRYEEYKKDTLEKSGYDKDVTKMVTSPNHIINYTDAILWADEHPDWHSVKDGDMPTKDGFYWIITNENSPGVGMFDRESNLLEVVTCTFGNEYSKVLHWMEIKPQK